MTTEIRLLGYRFRKGESLPDEVSNDVYDQLVLDVFLERPLGYFIWEVYMPATFIVVISWTSFWLERSAIPARVSLGVTTVLSITTLLSNSNDNLPPTAYPKVRYRIHPMISYSSPPQHCPSSSLIEASIPSNFSVLVVTELRLPSTTSWKSFIKTLDRV